MVNVYCSNGIHVNRELYANHWLLFNNIYVTLVKSKHLIFRLSTFILCIFTCIFSWILGLIIWKSFIESLIKTYFLNCYKSDIYIICLHTCYIFPGEIFWEFLDATKTPTTVFNSFVCSSAIKNYCFFKVKL